MDKSSIGAQNETTLGQLATDTMAKEIEYLQLQLSRLDNHPSILNSKNRLSFSQWHLANQILEETEERQAFFDHLKQEFIRIDLLVSEANIMSSEMEQQTSYSVFLQIPVSYLKPTERTISNLCEPAVQAERRDFSPQIWNREKFEAKLNGMRDIYRECQTSENKMNLLRKLFKRNNPFFDDKESNCLIGVANICLKALFYVSKLDYIVPIINTQGEISGTLHVVLGQSGPSSMNKFSNFQIDSTSCGSMSEGISPDTDEQSLHTHSVIPEDEGIDEVTSLSNDENDQITIKFSIKEARNLPQSDVDNIMCRYTFINPKLDQTIISVKSSDDETTENKSRVFSFDHENEYTFPITNQFLSTCLESSISVEVWHQYKTISQSINTTENNDDHLRCALTKQWKEVKRHIQFFIEIHELDPSGQWRPVQVDLQQQITSGGVYRLKQGQSRRLEARLRMLPSPGSMPFEFDAIQSVEIGSINTRKIGAPRQLDSYQDEELKCLRDEWINAIEKRKLYLESEVNKLNHQTDKTPNDIRIETILLEQLVRLAEERSIAAFPPPGSGIPGAPASWAPPPTIEIHRPLIFLNLDSVSMNTSTPTAGLQATLSEENEEKMFRLPLIHHASDQIRAVAQWDPTIHETPALNQPTSHDSLIYMIVKIVVIISKPVRMELVLRKRIALTIGKADNWWSGKIIKNILGHKIAKQTSVVYEIVASIPKSIHEIENLGLTNAADRLTEDYIEKYIRYASSIDSLLLVDKLRQEVLLAQKCEKQEIIRKTISASSITNEKRNTNLPRKSKEENFDSDDSTPSRLSRSSFIEQAQVKPTQSPSIRIRHAIDLVENKEKENETTLEEKYSSILTSQHIPSPSQRIVDDTNEDYSIGCQVLVNTDHIVDKLGIIHFIGKICVKRGTWYGVELKERVGKNNGSLEGNIYFQCPDKHGVFVRRDKLRLVN